MPAGAAPAGSGTGEPVSSVRFAATNAELADAADPPLIDVPIAATGLRRASTAPTPPVAATGVLSSSVNVPSRAIESREISRDPVLTVNRNRPLWVISTRPHACLNAHHLSSWIDLQLLPRVSRRQRLEHLRAGSARRPGGRRPARVGWARRPIWVPDGGIHPIPRHAECWNLSGMTGNWRCPPCSYCLAATR
jgi:hypothetical protein